MKTITEYHTLDGKEFSKDEVKAAYKAGKLLLVHQYTLDGDISSNVIVVEDAAKNGYDNRGQNWSAWEDTWTREPKNVSEALKAMAVRLAYY